MKRKLTFVLAVLLLAGLSVNAQTHFGIRFGGVFPTGDFGEAKIKDIDDISKWVLIGESKEGGAGVGFSLGMYWKFDIPSVSGLGIVFSFDGIYNGLNGDLNDFFDDLEDLRWDDSDVIEYETTTPKYLNVPIMLGVNYSYPLKDGLSVFGEAAVGLNVRLITNYEMNYIYDTYKDTDSGRDYYSVAISNVYEYDVATSFAFRIGTGITIKDKYSIGVDYFGLGSARVKGEYKYERVALDSRKDNTKFKFKELSPTMLMVRFGIQF